MTKQYLHIVGCLTQGKELLLRPTYVTPNSHNVTSKGDGPLYVELITPRTKKPKRIQLIAKPFMVDEQTSEDLLVFGKVPFPATTEKVRFVLASGTVLQELRVEKEKPELQLKWKPSKTAKLSGKTAIRFEGRSRTESPLEYLLEYSHDGGETWRRVGGRTTLSEIDVDFNNLPGGESCQLAVVATDGINTSRAVSDTFSVAAKPCQAMIIRPRPNQVYQQGESILLRGRGFYADEWRQEEKELVWQSSKDGKLGTGMALQVDGLSKGEHTITLTAGTKGRRSSASVTITVQ